jgi:hypothetical protein
MSKMETEFESWLHEEKLKLHYIYMIAPWMLENQQRIMQYCNRPGRGVYWADKFDLKNDVFTEIKIETGKFKERVSNTHNCPKNGVTNFTCKPDRPRGYPGWTGQVSGRLFRIPNKMRGYPYGSLLNAIGLHTGSGGGGNDNWSYGLSIFLDDWPGLVEEVIAEESDRIISKLQGKHV